MANGLGLHELVNNTIMKCKSDPRGHLYENIFLSGGSSMFLGFMERMSEEIEKIKLPSMKVKISASSERNVSSSEHNVSFKNY